MEWENLLALACTTLEKVWYCAQKASLKVLDNINVNFLYYFISLPYTKGFNDLTFFKEREWKKTIHNSKLSSRVFNYFLTP